MGFRTCHPKIWHLGILDILSWRNLRNGRCRKDSLKLSCSRSYDSHGKGVFSTPGGKEHPYLRRRKDLGKDSNEQPLLSPPTSPQVTLLSSYPSVLFSYDFALFIKPSTEYSGWTVPLGISLWRLPGHEKSTLNKCVCFFSLLICLLLTEPQPRTWNGRKRFFFFSYKVCILLIQMKFYLKKI